MTEDTMAENGGQVGQGESSKRKKRAILVMAVALVAVALAWVLWSTSEEVQLDPLCSYVENQSLYCPAIFASESVFRPGSITRLTNYSSGGVAESDAAVLRVDIPTSQLDAACLLPGANLVLPDPVPPIAFSLPSFSYSLEQAGGFKAGFPIPHVAGAEIQPGPKGARIRKIEISAQHARLRMLDENNLAQLLGDCRIRPSCVERIIENKDKLVNAILVAEDLSYQFFDQDGRAIGIEAGTKDGLIKFGGDLGSSQTASTKLTVSSPTVLGMTFVRDNVLATTDICSEIALFTVEGESVSKISGGGRRSVSSRSATEGLNSTAAVQGQGSERSECSHSFERSKSEASARSVVESGEKPGEIRVSSTANARGGHYVTAASCLGSNPVGRTGHDNGANAWGQTRGRINILARKEDGAVLRLNWSSASGTVSISVRGPSGETVLESLPISGDGIREVQLEGPGLYSVLVKGEVQASANGASGRDRESLSATVWPEVL